MINVLASDSVNVSSSETGRENAGALSPSVSSVKFSLLCSFSVQAQVGINGDRMEGCALASDALRREYAFRDSRRADLFQRSLYAYGAALDDSKQKDSLIRGERTRFGRGENVSLHKLPSAQAHEPMIVRASTHRSFTRHCFRFLTFFGRFRTFFGHFWMFLM